MGNSNEISGAPGATRTPDLWFRRPALYPTELQARRLRSSAFTERVACTPEEFAESVACVPNVPAECTASPALRHTASGLV